MCGLLFWSSKLGLGLRAQGLARIQKGLPVRVPARLQTVLTKKLHTMRFPTVVWAIPTELTNGGGEKVCFQKETSFRRISLFPHLNRLFQNLPTAEEEREGGAWGGNKLTQKLSKRVFMFVSRAETNVFWKRVFWAEANVFRKRFFWGRS